MIAKGSRIALEVVAGTLAVVMLLSVVALWRLTTAPVRLDFLSPHIEAAMTDTERGLFARVGHTELIWDGERRAIEFHTYDLRMLNRDGVTVAAFPDLTVRLSLRALVQGVIAPTAVEVVGARIRLVRDPEGNISFAQQDPRGGEAETDADFSEVLPSIIEQLLSDPSVERPLSFLTAVRIVRGRVLVDDQRLNLVWRAPVADIELRRDSAGLAGDIALVVEVGDSQARLSGEFRYPKDGDRIEVSGQFVGLRSEALIPLVPALQPFAGLTMAFDGALAAELTTDGRVESLRFEVAGVNGRLDAPEIFAEALELRRIDIRGQASGTEGQIDIDRLFVQLGAAETPGPEILASASLVASSAGFGGDLSIGLEAAITDLDISKLARYWPLTVKSARSWVLENLVHGSLDELRVQTALHLPGGRIDEAELRQLNGSLSYRDLEIHYWRPMPPGTRISGTAVFDRKSITFTPRSARLTDLQVESGNVRIVGLDVGREAVDIDLNIGGPIRAALELLDHERLGLIRDIGIDPTAADGRFAGNVKFLIPIDRPTTLDNIEVSAVVDLEQTVIRRFLLGRDVTEGQFSLTVNKNAMEVRGPLRFAGVPMDIVWNENFTAEAALRSDLEARIPRIDDIGRTALGLIFAPYLEGPIAVDLTYTNDQSRQGRLLVKADLVDAEMTLPQLYWDKPAGVAGRAEVALGLAAEKLILIESFNIEAGSLRARGSGRFDDAGKNVVTLALDDLQFDGSHLTDVTVDWLGEGTAVYIGGGTIDAAPFLAGDEARQSPAPQGTASNAANETEATTPAESTTESEKSDAQLDQAQDRAPKRKLDREPSTVPREFVPFALIAPKLDAIYIGPDHYLESVELELRRGRVGWLRMVVEALVPREFWSPERSPENGNGEPHGGTEQPGESTVAEEISPPKEPNPPPPPEPPMRKLRFDYRPLEDGRYHVEFESNDMGATLRALGKFATIHGGRVAIVGDSDGPLPNSPLMARIEARDYVLVQAPALASLLTVASLTGISDALNGEGIRFDRLIGDFVLTDGIMETDLLRAFGSGLGLTARGKIDFDESLVEMEGTLVPAYSVNRILGKIPLLGPILTGGEGEGLLALTYRMTGELDDPEVSVNPLSVLAPGFLRALFRGFGSDDGDEPRALPERSDP